MLSQKDLICDFIDIVSKNGCLLLNVGPKADGTIVEEEIHVLREIGRWLETNGEGIYNTTFWQVFGEGPTLVPEGHFSDTSRPPFTSQDIRYTYKEGAVYAFLMKMPASRHALLKTFACPENLEDDITIRSVSMLGSADKVSFSRDTAGLTLDFPGARDTCYPVCFRLELD